VVHYRVIDFADDDALPDDYRNPRNASHPMASRWALCGAAGSRKLREVYLPVTCKSCLRIAQRMWWEYHTKTAEREQAQQ